MAKVASDAIDATPAEELEERDASPSDGQAGAEEDARILDHEAARDAREKRNEERNELEDDPTRDARGEPEEEEPAAEEEDEPETEEEEPAEEDEPEADERDAGGTTPPEMCEYCGGSGVVKPDDGADEPEEMSATDGEQRVGALEEKVEELKRRLGEMSELRAFEARNGKIGGREIRSLPVDGVEVRDSGAGPGVFTLTGHAAVFDKESLDLGYFTEFIDRNAFDNVLLRKPDVHLNWDHDMRYVFARTANGTLELSTDGTGLAYWARVAQVSYAADLRELVEGGYVDQASFCFTVKRDRWEIEEDDQGNETVIRTILEVGELYDVCVTARGAYPQTDSQVVRTHLLDHARASAGDEEPAEDPAEDAPDDEAREASHVAVARAKARARRIRLSADGHSAA